VKNNDDGQDKNKFTRNEILVNMLD
jgi:hypothetical protein